jgi:hypothetical protein
MLKIINNNYFNITTAIICIVVVSMGIFQYVNHTSAQTPSSDAIAIRVLSNSSHLGVMDWYKEQGFSGSPQSLSIDGYDAVRDGRTVYVNAANIIGNTLYTNIFVISYNQDSEKVTVDIFGRIINKWNFNTNVTTTGHCRGDMTKICLIDEDCSRRDFCDSKKARVVRDVKRLSDLAIVKRKLENYRSDNGYYPKLSQGTYLPQRTTSVWPSWDNEFGGELSTVIPTDPVNQMGDCTDTRFTKDTCWDETKKQFDDQDASTNKLDLPNNSLVYTYHGTRDGSYYDFCGVMESGYILASGSCSGSGICLSGGTNSINSSQTAVNNPPEFTGYNFLPNYSGEVYESYVEAVDPDGDAITWTFTPTDFSYTPLAFPVWSSWTAPTMPVLRPSAVARQRILYSTQSGSAGPYYFTITLDDNRGEANSVVTNNFYLTVSTPRPVIASFTCPAVTRVTNPYTCSITASHPSNPVSFSFRNLPPGITPGAVTSAGVNHTIQLTGPPTIDSAGAYVIEVTAIESSGTRSEVTRYSLTVNNYCGDGVMQKPNTEHADGPNSDGNEACDAPDNVAVTAIASNVNMQYGCSGDCENTGGYCGDNNSAGIQSTYEQCDDGQDGNDYNECLDTCQNTTCGDDMIQTPNGDGDSEQCDGSRLNSATCQTQGYTYGSLSCRASDCQYDESACCNPTDGVWSSWVDGTCNPTSGGYGSGTEVETRTCAPPSCGGSACDGNSSQIRACCSPANCGFFPVGYTNVDYDDGCGGTLTCCTDNSWGPQPSTVCSADTFTQTSNCGNTTTGVNGSLACDDSDSCTYNNCSAGACSYPTDPAMDGQVCGPDDTCVSGVCTPNCTPLTCSGTTYGCGTYNDGCGGTLDCGACADVSYRCWSIDYRYSECTFSAVSVLTAIRLHYRSSSSGCNSTSFGIVSGTNRVWVNYGCRANWYISGY